jgi:hydrogenase maturation protease
MNVSKTRCLILSCGNTLRGDDGIGPFLSEWARDHFAGRAEIAVLTQHQWTPDLAADLAETETALFIDCSVEIAAGEICLETVEPAAEQSVGSHHMDAAQLLALALSLYASLPHRALLLTVGAGSLELSEEFSPAVRAALPKVQAQLAAAVEKLLAP